MSDETQGGDDRQNPLVHEGGGAAPNYDTNEKADDKVEIQQPSGETISPAREEGSE